MDTCEYWKSVVLSMVQNELSQWTGLQSLETVEKCAFLWLISQPASDCSEWREKYIEGMSWHIGGKQLFARLHFVFRHRTWEFLALPSIVDLLKGSAHCEW